MPTSRLLVALVLGPSLALACAPEARPLCGRTGWAAAIPTGNAVVPGPTLDLRLPLELAARLDWDAGPTGQEACAQLESASATASVSCSDADGEAASIEPFEILLPMPPGPGLLDLGEVEDNLVFGVGVIDRPMRCTASLEITATFEAEFGGGTLLLRDEATVEITERSPADPVLPRVTFRRVLPSDEVLRRGGDEATWWFLAENNDDEQGVQLAVDAVAPQLAVHPLGEDPDDAAFAGGGNAGAGAAVRFVGDAGPELLALGDVEQLPTDTWDHELAPLEVALVPVRVRPHGNCDIGAAWALELTGAATFDDGTQADLQAGALLRSELTVRRSPQCEITDTLEAAPTVNTIWSPAIFDGPDWHATHAAGNLRPSEGGPGMRVTGLLFASPYPRTSEDLLRLDAPPTRIVWSLNAFPSQVADGQLQHLDVTVVNYDAVDVVNLPSLYVSTGPGNLGVTLDAATLAMTVTDQDSGELLFDGSGNDLLLGPPAPLTLDLDTLRSVAVDCSDRSRNLLLATPGSVAAVLEWDEPAEFATLVTERGSGLVMAWSADGLDEGVDVAETEGTAGEPLVILAEGIPELPHTLFGRISVDGGDAIDGPIELPVALRRRPAPPPDDDDSDDDDDSADDDDSGLAPGDDDDSTPPADDGCDCNQSGGGAAPLLLLLALGRRRCG